MNESFISMQKYAGILKEGINEPIDWDWNKARSTSEDDEGVVYKVWGKGESHNYYAQFELPHTDDGSRNDITDKNTRKLGQFIYLSKWTKDTDEKVEEIDPAMIQVS